MGIKTIIRIVHEVFVNIWALLCEEYMPTPTMNKWVEIACNFEKIANFPNCIGAIDGKHIKNCQTRRKWIHVL